MEVDKVIESVTSHLEKKFSELNSPNELEVSFIHGARAWLNDYEHPHYHAAGEACQKVFGSYPGMLINDMF